MQERSDSIVHSSSLPVPFGWAKKFRFSLLAASAMSLSACGPDILAPVGPVGAGDSAILIDSVGIMLAIILPTMFAIALFAWWFRSSNTRARYLPHFSYSGQIEMVVWGIPALVILLLGGVAWIGSHDLDPAAPLASKAKPLDIQVVSLDWKWLFIYPDQKIATLNDLVVPVGVPLHFSLTSASVMTAFFVPQFGSMIYTMNGMRSELNLQGDKIGTYHGEAAHFSGDGFPDMWFKVHVVSAPDFAAWLQKNDNGPALDAKRYLQMEKPTQGTPPAIFKLADPNLFAAILTQKLPPAPGPNPAIIPQ
jgi:cytochrome o ubiquinol oxidase subunit II